MEALVVVFAEIIIACMMPVISLFGAVLAAIFEGLMLLLSGVFGEWGDTRRKRKTKTPDRPSTARKPFVTRKAIHWIAGSFALVGVMGIVASYVLFQPILRYAMYIASDKAQMSVSYEKATGSLLGGRVVLEGLALSRVHDTGLAFDLAVARAEADVSLTSLTGRTPRLILGQVDGITGTITPPLPKEQKRGLPKRKRPFRADLFALGDVDVQIMPRGEDPFSVVINAAQVSPFRSSLALFDLLFRSNLTAEIAGQSLSVGTREITENGRETFWRFEDVDAAQLKRVLPKPPLSWVEDGRITVSVSDKWSLSEDFVDMDWRIATADMRTSVPEGIGATERVVATGLSKYLSTFGGDVDFRYRLTLDPDDMEQLRDGDLNAFWQKALSGIVKGRVVPDTAAARPKEEADRKPTVVDRFKSIFNRNKSGD